MHNESLFLTVLESNIINFLIMMSILVWIFKKFNLGKIIDNLADDIKNNVVTSAEAAQNALKEYKETRKESREIPNKKQEILDDAKESVKRLDEKSLEEIKQKVSELEDNSEKMKEAYTKRTVQKTAQTIKDAVYELSKKSIANMLNYDVQNKIVKDCLDELDRINEVRF